MRLFSLTLKFKCLFDLLICEVLFLEKSDLLLLLHSAYIRMVEEGYSLVDQAVVHILRGEIYISHFVI